MRDGRNDLAAVDERSLMDATATQLIDALPATWPRCSTACPVSSRANRA